MSQHMEALAMGDAIRLEMAALKRELASLPRPEAFALLADWLDNPSDTTRRMRPGVLISSVHRVGPKVASRFMVRAGISGAAQNRRIGPLDEGFNCLTHEQRCRLSDLLREMA